MLTSEAAIQIVNDYRVGLAYDPICKKYGVGTPTVRNVLINAGVPIRARASDKSCPELKREAVRLFDDGVSVPDIAKKLGIRNTTVRNYTDAAGRMPRSKGDGKRRRFPLNEGCFDVFSDDMVYWLGVLMADGCLSEGHTVSLSFHEQDIDHLTAFKKFVGAENHSTTRGQTKVCSTRFRSKRIADRVRSLGIVERKSLTAEAGADLRSNRFFWLGLVDGDGFVSRSGHNNGPVIGLCGSPILVRQFVEFVSGELGLPTRNITRHKTIGTVSYHGGNAVAVTRLLWDGHDLGMPRKRRIAAENIQTFSHLKMHLLPRGTSKFRGVVKVRERGKYTGRWSASYRGRSLGRFASENAAAAAYTRVAFNLCSSGQAPKRTRKIITAAAFAQRAVDHTDSLQLQPVAASGPEVRP